ncbi:coiled-coil domain-containing protein 25-like [Diadema setosum]|uniref:coiled-coil domain-containing protein 25-like n=1 Tax=Diadema setosum TaxID=31175 RepID=UPI003B3BBBA9
MVFYFTSNVVSPPYTIYVGEDKYENEELIKYGFPEDVWFHVDKLSSAHVYLRLKKGQTMDDIPGSVLEDCAQLVKANSIQGSKMNDIAVVYTPWENLKKTGDMAVGQVGFKKAKEVRTVKVAKKISEIVNRLNKTKKELKPDLRLEKEARDREEREEAKKELKEKRKQEEEMLKKKKEQAELRSYKSLMREENMTSNANNTEEDLEDDFM